MTTEKAETLRSHGPQHRDRYGTYTYNKDKYRSVTTILNSAFPKPALPYWSAKCVAEHVTARAKLLEARAITGKELLPELLDTAFLSKIPWQKRDDKADLGTRIHDILERAGSGDEVNPADYGELAGYVTAYMAWVSEYQPEYLAIEAEVFNRDYGYAGTLDSIVRFGNMTYIVDYKTSGDTYDSHALQLAAYRHAEFLLVGDKEIPMPTVDAGAILLIHPTGCRLMEWPCGQAEFDVFAGLIKTDAWIKSKVEASPLRSSDFKRAQEGDVR